MDKKTILIVGVGQLGSRYLQGMAGVDYPLDIFLVDPSKQSLETAVDRFRVTSPKQEINIKLLSSVHEIDKEVDLAIIATTANVRLQVIQGLLQSTKIHHWILEKILFQNIREYDIAEKIFYNQCSRQWVNCAQRLWPFFIELKQWASDPNLVILATGSNWGLACNAVHNTDIAHFIWGTELRHTAYLDKTLQRSKRAGFVEFTGIFDTHAKNGGLLRQISYQQDNSPFSFTAIHPSFHRVWNILTGKLIEANEQTNWQWQEREMAVPLQSQITGQIVNDIFQKSECGLPRFEESVALHRETLQTLLDSARYVGHDFGVVCPIT